MLFIFRDFSFAYMGEAVVLIVLAVVEAYLLAIYGDTHRYQPVYQGVANPTHDEGIDKDDDDGKQVIKEYHESIPCAGYQAFLNEDAGQYGAEDTACAVGREYVEGIIYADA